MKIFTVPVISRCRCDRKNPSRWGSQSRSRATDADFDDKTFDQPCKPSEIDLKMLLDSATYPIQRTLLSERSLHCYSHDNRHPTVIAAYPWFRDGTLHADGVTRIDGSSTFSLASLLSMLGHYCYQGLIPNGFAEPDGNRFTTASTAFCGGLAARTLSRSQIRLGVSHAAISDVKQIYKAFTAGTLYNVPRIDAS
jgi:glycogen debranching enzyme